MSFSTVTILQFNISIKAWDTVNTYLLSISSPDSFNSNSFVEIGSKFNNSWNKFTNCNID